ncbi:hypothetical protein [Amycolatopsis sp. GM8]|uniref:hypothetical protein n=1 Tax=Amycolatopsis sp. GM8 TaxID=2896530 RepID=UPI001F29BAA4|nr:hypothetical protein [Amycolatopsis sp. GM8]
MGSGFTVDLSGLAAAGKALTEGGADAAGNAGSVHACRTNIEFTDGCTLDELLQGAAAQLPLRKLETTIATLADSVERRQKHLADELDYAGTALLNIRTMYARADGQDD